MNSGLVVRNDSVAIFDTARFEHMYRVAKAMASTTLVPDHLQGQDANCLMICQQADRWDMDPFAVAQCTFVTKGKLGYEGKLIAAVINARARLKGRLRYDIEGEGNAMSITVSGTFQDEDEPRIIKATWAEGRKMSQGGAKWQELPDQMLCYYGARKWGRRHAPELMLGILSDDEVPAAAGMRDITPETERPPAKQIDSLDDLVDFHDAEVLPPDGPRNELEAMVNERANGHAPTPPHDPATGELAPDPFDDMGGLPEDDGLPPTLIRSAKELLQAIDDCPDTDRLSQLDLNMRKLLEDPTTTWSDATKNRLMDAMKVTTRRLFSGAA